MHPVLQTIHNNLKSAKKVVWIRDEPTDDDIEHVLKEGSSDSQFDPLRLRAATLADLKAGKAKLVTRRCYNAKVLAVVYDQEIPWELFGKIFSAFGYAKKPWRLLWFANPTKRTYDPRKEPGPAEMNGGYTYPCTPDTIVVYREEEAARVLIHELLHAACTDNMDDPVELREAKTETWAEIFLAVICGGTNQKAQAIWDIQAQYIADQEFAMRQSGVNSPKNYAWRYTVARRAFLEKLGFRLPEPSYKISLSSRLTHPAICP